MRPNKGSGALLGSFFLALAALVVLTGFVGWAAEQNPQEKLQQTQLSGVLPSNPEEWVCKASTTPVTQKEIDEWCAEHPNRDLAVPVELRNPPSVAEFAKYADYSTKLRQFLTGVLTGPEYEQRGWIFDAKWRFSGPSVTPPNDFSHNYGPHFPLRAYYSPEVVDWLFNDRKGEIPDGAMIVKAISFSFSSLDIKVVSDGCMDLNPASSPTPNLWAPMIKSSRSSYDGWPWMLQQFYTPLLPLPPPQFPPPLLDQPAFTGGTFSMPIQDNPSWYPTGSLLQDFQTKIQNVVMLNPLAGFPYCLSCHSTAESQSTFASMDNILGKDLRYKVFNSPMAPIVVPTPTASTFSPFPKPLSEPSQAFQTFFNQLGPVSFANVWNTRMPAESYEQQVTSAHGGPAQFLTAAQCNAVTMRLPKARSRQKWCLWRSRPMARTACVTYPPTGNRECHQWAWRAVTQFSSPNCRAKPTVSPSSQAASKTPVSTATL